MGMVIPIISLIIELILIATSKPSDKLNISAANVERIIRRILLQFQIIGQHSKFESKINTMLPPQLDTPSFKFACAASVKTTILHLERGCILGKTRKESQECACEINLLTF